MALVPVAFANIRSSIARLPAVRFVKFPFSEKKFVVVALVPVAFTKVNPLRV